MSDGQRDSEGEVQKVLRQIRKRRGYKQAEISEIAGVHRTYWEKYEQGKRRPSLTFIARMRRTIDLTDEEVLALLHATEKDDEP